MTEATGKKLQVGLSKRRARNEKNIMGKRDRRNQRPQQLLGLSRETYRASRPQDGAETALTPVKASGPDQRARWAYQNIVGIAVLNDCGYTKISLVNTARAPAQNGSAPLSGTTDTIRFFGILGSGAILRLRRQNQTFPSFWRNARLSFGF